MDSLSLSCRALSFPTTCRFIPAHSGLPVTSIRVNSVARGQREYLVTNPVTRTGRFGHRQNLTSLGVKLYTQNVLKHGRFCCDPSCFEGASIAGLLPDPVPGLALPLDGR